MQGLFLQPIAFVIGEGLFTRLRGNTSRFIDNKERLLRKHLLMLKLLDNSGYKHEMGLLTNSLR